MSIFLPIQGGGWVNAANVVRIAENMAYVAHASVAYHIQLSDEWEHPDQQLILGEGPLTDGIRKINSAIGNLNYALAQIGSLS